MAEYRAFQMEIEEAQALAIEALTFFSSDPGQLADFLSTSGLRPQDLRDLADSGALHAGVLDYVTRNESLLVAFAADRQIPAERVMAAHLCLSPPDMYA